MKADAEPTTVEQGGISLTGKLIEVGNLDAGGRGLSLEMQGETVEIVGLTAAECQWAGRKLGEIIRVHIDAQQLERGAQQVSNSEEQHVCSHGQLARSCEICELQAEVERQRLQIIELKACLMDAVDWNWLEDDRPKELYRKYRALADT